jgi:Spy/CpxP family protein refolding chaperone
MKEVLFLATVAALAGCAGSTEHVHSAYAGQESRAVKSLSEQEVKGLLEGAGMGYAKAAELNRYPGPMHTLELASSMGLSAAQRKSIEELLQRHKAEARELGSRVLAGEKDLDQLFASGVADPNKLTAVLNALATEQAALRASHLKAHLATTALLSPEQVERYQSLRGYASAR